MFIFRKNLKLYCILFQFETNFSILIFIYLLKRKFISYHHLKIIDRNNLKLSIFYLYRFIYCVRKVSYIVYLKDNYFPINHFS